MRCETKSNGSQSWIGSIGSGCGRCWGGRGAKAGARAPEWPAPRLAVAVRPELPSSALPRYAKPETPWRRQINLAGLEDRWRDDRTTDAPRELAWPTTAQQNAPTACWCSRSTTCPTPTASSPPWAGGWGTNTAARSDRSRMSGVPDYQQVDIDKLDPATAVGLLRTRGVKGPDAVLEPLARDHGCHALTADLIGGYIARACDGDPAKLPPARTAGILPALDAEDLDPTQAAIRRQERQLGRLIEWYHDILTETDPGALAPLQRLSLFRLGVGADTLASIFTGEDKADVSSSELASLNREGVEGRLKFLVAIRLIESSEARSPIANGQSPVLYTVHSGDGVRRCRGYFRKGQGPQVRQPTLRGGRRFVELEDLGTPLRS